MSTRIAAVTGASGLIGRALCARLAGRGWEVRALVRDPAAFGPPPANVRVGRCDLPDALDDSLLAGASAIVHCAYATRETDRERARQVNEDGTRKLLEASRRAEVLRFVLFSTVAAHPDAPNYYARSKYALEGLCDPGRDLVVRPGLVLARQGQGIFQMMRDVARKLHVIPLFGGGRQPLQTVHLDDLCGGVARALERDLTGALNLGEPAPLTMVAFLRAMVARLGVRCVFLPLPFAPVLAGLHVVEALRLPFPLRSESVLAIKGLRQVPVADDLRRLDLSVRSANESLADVL
jgi:nucleoside-diphosphate-sugar epimerase